MAWIKTTRKIDGTKTFWVHEWRDNRMVTLAECASEDEAKKLKEEYDLHAPATEKKH
jgi:hypothetical protein